MPLLIDGERVDDHEVIIEKLRERDFARVVVDPECLGVAAVVADLLIGRGFVGAVGIADLGPEHAVELVKEFLHAPKAAARKVNGFGVHDFASFCIRNLT